MKKYEIAVLDDYQNVALESADWSVLHDGADITVFQDHLSNPVAVIERNTIRPELSCVLTGHWYDLDGLAGCYIRSASPPIQGDIATHRADKYTLKCHGWQQAIFARSGASANRVHRHDKRYLSD